MTLRLDIPAERQRIRDEARLNLLRALRLSVALAQLEELLRERSR